MTALDTRARASAARAINKAGKAMTFTHRAPGTYDPNTSSTAPTETTQPVKAFLTSPSKEQLNAGVLATSMVAMLPALGLNADPKPGDRFAFDGLTFSVGWTDRIWSGEQVALWFVELKK